MPFLAPVDREKDVLRASELSVEDLFCEIVKRMGGYPHVILHAAFHSQESNLPWPQWYTTMAPEDVIKWGMNDAHVKHVFRDRMQELGVHTLSLLHRAEGWLLTPVDLSPTSQWLLDSMASASLTQLTQLNWIGITDETEVGKHEWETLYSQIPNNPFALSTVWEAKLWELRVHGYRIENPYVSLSGDPLCFQDQAIKFEFNSISIKVSSHCERNIDGHSVLTWRFTSDEVQPLSWFKCESEYDVEFLNWELFGSNSGEDDDLECIVCFGLGTENPEFCPHQESRTPQSQNGNFIVALDAAPSSMTFAPPVPSSMISAPPVLSTTTYAPLSTTTYAPLSTMTYAPLSTMTYADPSSMIYADGAVSDAPPPATRSDALVPATDFPNSGPHCPNSRPYCPFGGYKKVHLLQPMACGNQGFSMEEGALFVNQRKRLNECCKLFLVAENKKRKQEILQYLDSCVARVELFIHGTQDLCPRLLSNTGNSLVFCECGGMVDMLFKKKKEERTKSDEIRKLISSLRDTFQRHFPMMRWLRQEAYFMDQTLPNIPVNNRMTAIKCSTGDIGKSMLKINRGLTEVTDPEELQDPKFDTLEAERIRYAWSLYLLCAQNSERQGNFSLCLYLLVVFSSMLTFYFTTNTADAAWAQMQEGMINATNQGMGMASKYIGKNFSVPSMTQAEQGKLSSTTVLVCIPLVTGFFMSLEKKFKPSNKFSVFKSAAGQLKSEIYKYRCRAGIYNGFQIQVKKQHGQSVKANGKPDGKNEDATVTNLYCLKPRQHFADQIGKIKSAFEVMLVDSCNMIMPDEIEWSKLQAEMYVGKESSSYKSNDQQTSWRYFTLTNCCKRAIHRKSCKPGIETWRQLDQNAVDDPIAEDEDDDGFSPLDGDKYVKFRLALLTRSVDEQLRADSFRHGVLLTFMFASTALSAIFAYFGADTYIVMSAAFGTVLKSFIEFMQYERRIVSANTAASMLRGVLVWWKSLDGYSKMQPYLHEKLVIDTENAAQEFYSGIVCGSTTVLGPETVEEKRLENIHGEGSLYKKPVL